MLPARISAFRATVGNNASSSDFCRSVKEAAGANSITATTSSCLRTGTKRRCGAVTVPIPAEIWNWLPSVGLSARSSLNGSLPHQTFPQAKFSSSYRGIQGKAADPRETRVILVAEIEGSVKQWDRFRDSH